jgi:putative ABC transport system substrate-binding protein
MNTGKEIMQGLHYMFAFLLAVVWMISGGCTEKKQKVYHVGILSGLGFFANTTDGFKEKMTELGYIEGSNIIYDLQNMNFDIAAYKSVLDKFVADKVDLIFVFPTEATQEAKAAAKGTGIPVVFASVFIEDTGIVDSVRQPGGNITGVRWAGPDIAVQHFEIMRELTPNATRMFIPYLKGYPIVKSQLEALRLAFSEAGMTMIELPASNAAELETEFNMKAESANSRTDVILMLAEPLCVSSDGFTVIGKFADEHNIPVGGSLISVGGHESVFGLIPQNIPAGRQAAYLADKVLKGAEAGTIPVVTAECFLQINFRAANKLGITVPEGLLSRANEIIR